MVTHVYVGTYVRAIITYYFFIGLQGDCTNPSESELSLYNFHDERIVVMVTERCVIIATFVTHFPVVFLAERLRQTRVPRFKKTMSTNYDTLVQLLSVFYC